MKKTFDTIGNITFAMAIVTLIGSSYVWGVGLVLVAFAAYCAGHLADTEVAR